MSQGTWDHEVDVLVVGSGAAGLAAALTAALAGAEVEIIEKAELLGGTSAWSGGMPWLPCNDHMADVGVEDSREAALTYINSLGNDRLPEQALLERFVDTAAEALRFLEANSALDLGVAVFFSDYYADHPGGKPRGRSLEPRVMDARAVLGEWADRVRDSPHMPRMSQDEMLAEGARRNVPLKDGEVPLDIAALLAEREAQGFRANGAAMVSGLLRGVVDAGVGIRVATPAVELVTRDGEVVGVLAEHEGAALRIGVRKGVILASGGFEWNAELVTAYLGTPDVFSLTVPGNVGDGLRMGLEVGATVANMTNCVGIPVTYDGHSVLEGRPHGSLAVPRHDPGVARIESAPFYAMPHRDGILGTTGGLRTDPDARVRAMRGGVVEGLYAVGNVAANIFGQAYPGGGSTLGPGLTFGYLAGQHAAGAPSRDPGE